MMKPGPPRKPARPRLFYSYKSRVIAVLVISSLVPLVLIGAISYYTITSRLDNKVENGVKSQMLQTALALDKELQNLNHVAMQLSYEEGIGKTIAQYLSSSEDGYEKYRLEQTIRDYMFMITYTNPNIGLIRYYFSDSGEPAFPRIGEELDDGPERLSKLRHFSGITYHGIHPSLDPKSDSPVLSVDRKMFLPDYSNLHLYVETNTALVPQILGDKPFGMKAAHLMIDEYNRIVYSEKADKFPVGSAFMRDGSEELPFQTRESYIFTVKTDHHWTFAALISKADFNLEKNQWLRQLGAIAIFSLALALLLAVGLWRTACKPLSQFTGEIRSLRTSSDFQSPLKFPRIAEFDFVLERFQDMRHRIRRFMLEVEHNEKMKARLEAEKLQFQINPHFIHNTLDTVRWLARLNGQDDIERLVSKLNKVLYYNMGKGETATIRHEIESLNDYVDLQQIRYDFRFEVDIRAEGDLLDLPIPRFVLQPLVENALYHGIRDDGRIEVKASIGQDDFIRIEVSDNGTGMNEQEIRRLLDNGGSGGRQRSGMGIGIRYVSGIIRAYYGDRAGLDITSSPNSGTSIVLRIPIDKRAGSA